MNFRSTPLVSFLGAVSLAAAGLGSLPASAGARPFLAAQPGSAAQPAKGSDKAKTLSELYTLPTCPISGETIGAMGDAVVKAYDGREVRFCCDQCPPKFEKDLAASFAKLDAAIVKDQLPLYPLDTSIVSGKTLGAAPVDWVYHNRLIRLADAGEKAGFLKDPKKYLADLDKAAVQKQSKDYPLKTCPVSKDDLGEMGEAKDVVVGGRLIKLCCNDCRKNLAKDPAKFIAVIDAARNPKGADHGKGGEHADHAGSPGK